MKTNRLLAFYPALVLTVLATLCVMSGAAFAADMPAPGAYQIDAMHSKVGFEVQHLVISTVEGKFKNFSGNLMIGKTMPASKLTATVEIASVDTGVEKRDVHLKSVDFFDAEKFPKMTFESTAITGTPAHFKMKGTLTLKGVSKPVTFDSEYLGSAPDGYGNIKAAFHAKTKINRKDFGLNWSNVVEKAPVVGDMVTIELKIEAGMPAPKSAATAQ